MFTIFKFRSRLVLVCLTTFKIKSCMLVWGKAMKSTDSNNETNKFADKAHHQYKALNLI